MHTHTYACKNKLMINFWQMCDTKEMWHTSRPQALDHKMAALAGWLAGWMAFHLAGLPGILIASTRISSSLWQTGIRGVSSIANLAVWHQVPQTAHALEMIDCSCSVDRVAGFWPRGEGSNPMWTHHISFSYQLDNFCTNSYAFFITT